MIELKKPSVKATKDSEKIEELRRYLFSLIEDLNFVLLDHENQITAVKGSISAMSVATADYTEATPDAMAYDGMAYEGDMPAVEAVEIEETIEEGEKEDEQIRTGDE